LKVLHVSAYFTPAYCYGGPPRSIHALCRALIACDVDVSVLTTAANGDWELAEIVIAQDEFQGVPVTYLERSSPKSFFYTPSLKAWLSSEISKYDIVHIHGCWNYMVWMTGYICRKYSVPYVISPKGMLEPEALKISSLKKKVAYSLVERKQLKHAACLLATSEKERVSIEALELGVPSVVTPYGINLAKCIVKNDLSLRKRLKILSDDFVVLFVGRIHPIKGLDVLCEGIKLAILTAPNIRLLLVGDGDVEYVRQLKNEFNVLIESRHLFFLGHLEDEEKADAYQSSDVFALMSHSENFGLAVAEAMSYGLPVILSKGCPWPQVIDWGCGFWIDAEPVNVASMVRNLVDDREHALSMGRLAKESAALHLDWKSMALRVKSIYVDVLR